MMSNFKRVVTLTLLVSAASSVLAAPAPVSDLNDSGPVGSSRTSSSSENDVQRLERLLQNSTRVQLRLQQQIDSQEEEITKLRGELERNSYEMQQMLQRQRQLFIDLDDLRSEMKTAMAAPKVAAPVPAQVGDDNVAISSDSDENSAYQAAVDMILKEKNYDGAISAFKQFQTQYPQSSYAANTHYWLGQLYFAKRQDVDAAKSFASVVSYADSNKRADALAKLGDIAKRNNNNAAAQKYYQQVVTEYPNSSAAKQAQANLK